MWGLICIFMFGKSSNDQHLIQKRQWQWQPCFLVSAFNMHMQYCVLGIYTECHIGMHLYNFYFFDFFLSLLDSWFSNWVSVILHQYGNTMKKDFNNAFYTYIYIKIICILSYCFVCVCVCLYFVSFSLKGALFLLKGVFANPKCTVSVFQNKSVDYMISEPTRPGCITDWSSAVSTACFFVLVNFQTFVPSGKNNHISNICIDCLVSRTPCLLTRRGTFTIQLFCMLNHKGFSP